MFEDVFADDTSYIEHVTMDEVFSYLIGGETEPNFNERLEQDAFASDHNLGMIVLLHEWMQILIKDAIDLEYYEIANNCKQLKTKLNEIIHTPDSGDSSEC